MSLTLLPVLGTPFPPTGLPSPAVICGFGPNLTISCSVEIPRRPALFLRKIEGGVDLGERGCRERDWEEGKLWYRCIYEKGIKVFKNLNLA